MTSRIELDAVREQGYGYIFLSRCREVLVLEVVSSILHSV